MVQFANLFLTWYNYLICFFDGTIYKYVPYLVQQLNFVSLMVQFANLFLTWYNYLICFFDSTIYKLVPYLVQ